MRKSLYLVFVAGLILGLVAQQQPPVPTVPLNFRQQIANTPNASKADTLAQGILTVQNEVVDLRRRASQADSLTRQQTNQLFTPLQESAKDHEIRLGKVENNISPIVQHIKALEDKKFDKPDCNPPSANIPACFPQFLMF